jgi:hypothetical protein
MGLLITYNEIENENWEDGFCMLLIFIFIYIFGLTCSEVESGNWEDGFCFDKFKELSDDTHKWASPHSLWQRR